MREVETISWRELTGNKFSKAIDAAMLSDEGYVRPLHIKRIGDFGKSLFYVVFDRKYLVEWVSRKLCKPLFVLGKQGTLDLVAEAWDYCYGKTETKEPAKAVGS